MNKDSSHSLFR